jgi:hypothetical protein
MVAGLLLGIVPAAMAQERPRPAIELSGGWVGFADDGIVSEVFVGSAARWYVLPRIGIGPEVVYMRGDNHNHVVITGNLTWDLLPDVNQKSRGVIPFLVVGGGIFQTRQSFPGNTFTSREGAFTAGGGLRAHLSDRVSAGVDVRVGWELHVRAGGVMAIALGR